MQPSTTLIACLCGGMGNQLFIYAAARRLALVHCAELVLDTVSGFVRDRQYNRQYALGRFSIPCRHATPRERLEPFRFLRRLWLRRCAARLPFAHRRYLCQEGMDFDPRLLDVQPRGTVYLEGYWQSEGYFRDVAETIRADLQITPPLDPVNQACAAEINASESVAVHIRHFDPPGAEHDGTGTNVHASYYRRAVDEMENRLEAPRYFVFSDRPEACAGLLPVPEARITHVSHNTGDDHAYADLWLMRQCRHFIIANSTFSWWGAWLGCADEKVVIAPDVELRDGVAFWGFRGLLPEEWMVR